MNILITKLFPLCFAIVSCVEFQCGDAVEVAANDCWKAGVVRGVTEHGSYAIPNSFCQQKYINLAAIGNGETLHNYEERHLRFARKDNSVRHYLRK